MLQKCLSISEFEKKINTNFVYFPIRKIAYVEK